MGDLLAAGSLLLTVVTILYSIWYPEISAATATKVDDLPANNKAAYLECRNVLWWKTIPLCVIATALCLINLPDALKILFYAISQISSVRHAHYSAVNTTFVIV